MPTDPLGDPDIERAARLMIALNGPLAESRARARAADLSRTGEHNAAAIWDQVSAAIGVLQVQAGAPESGASGPEPRHQPMQEYRLTLIGTSGQAIAIEVLPAADDREAIADARGLFSEYPKVAEIIVRRDSVVIARLER